MTSFAANILPESITGAVSDFLTDNPLLGNGLTALAVRWAVRSGPVLIALLGAGLLYRHLRKTDQAKPAATKRGKAGTRSARPARKTAKTPRSAAA